MILGAVFYAIILGAVTTAIAGLDSHKQPYLDKVDKLHNFIESNGLDEASAPWTNPAPSPPPRRRQGPQEPKLALCRGHGRPDLGGLREHLEISGQSCSRRNR